MDTAWYVVHSKPRKETQLYSYLCAKDIQAYYPTLTVKPVNPRSSKIRPYFPSYMFVHVNLEQIGKSILEWMPFATGLVEFGGEPAIVTDNFIAELKQSVAKMKAEYDLGIRGIKSGDPVRIMSGAFAGYEGIFDTMLNGEERAQILLHWLGRQLKVNVDANFVEKQKARR
jgi:transcription antitermination factor NusG